MANAGFSRSELVLIAGAAAVVFTRVFAFSLVLPGFREHGDALAGATDLLVGTALGAYGLTMAVSQLANGVLSDRFGRRPLLVLGTLFFVAGSAWAAVADSIATLLAARLLQGAGAVSSVAMAAVGETVPASRRTTAMALIGIPAGLGFFVGFAAGPLLEPLTGFRGLFWVVAGIGAVAVLPLLARPLPGGQTTNRLLPERSQTGAVLALASGGFAINFAMTQLAFFLPTLPLGQGALLGSLGFAFVVMAVVSRFVDRRGQARLAILVALATLPMATLLLLPANGASVALAAAAAFFATHAVLSALLPSQVSRIAGRSGGRGHGIQLVVAYAGSAVGGVIAGLFADAPLAAAGVVAAVAVAAALLVTVFLRPHNVPEPGMPADLP